MTLDNMKIIICVTFTILLISHLGYSRSLPGENQNFKTKAQKIINSVCGTVRAVSAFWFIVLFVFFCFNLIS